MTTPIYLLLKIFKQVYWNYYIFADKCELKSRLNSKLYTY